MSWHCSRALVEEYLAANYLDGARYVRSSITPTPDQYYWPDKTTEHSRLSRFGMMCAPLTERLGEGMLMWFREAFRARTSVRPETVLASMGPGQDSGLKWQGSFARYNRDSFSWKTAQCSLVEGLDEFSETWPRWGSMRNGGSYLRQIPALPICESESGFWPTPTVPNGGRSMTQEMALNGGYTTDGVKRQIGLENAVKHWPTPKANDAEKRGNFNIHNPRNGLPAAAKRWPTPTCASADKEVVSSQSYNNLVAFAKMFPTPTATDGKGAPTLDSVKARALESKRGVRLPEQLARDGDIGQLNPDWVEWLMGWPIGWTDLKPLATDRFQEWLQQHGTF